MKIYGLTGKMRAGKDSFYAIAAERIHCLRLAYADGVKSECAGACGISVEQINADKSRFRPLLQWWGTDFRRHQDPSYWINQMAERLDNLPQCSTVFVTDVRFENEADLIRSRGGEIIRVIRINAPEAGSLAGHASETEMEGIKADYTLAAENISDLREAVDHWINKNS